MSIVEQKLTGFPRVLRLYKKACCLFDDYVTYFPHRWRYYRARMQKKSSVVILCYPHAPRAFHSLYRIAAVNGYALSTNPHRDATVAVYFEDTTCAADIDCLTILPKHIRVINSRCLDIRKSTVDRIHQQIFGYSPSIDPMRYAAPYVIKTEENSMHTYRILYTPEMPQPGYVYQKVIDNEEGDDVRDIRVLIFGAVAPFCFLKYRPILHRFGSSTRGSIVKTESVLSLQECRTIQQYCQVIGLEFGELDVLRDRDTGKIYIVDVNKTPDSPLSCFNTADFQRGLVMLSAAFHEAFVSKTLS